jgi:hypothetical protein
MWTDSRHGLEWGKDDNKKVVRNISRNFERRSIDVFSLQNGHYLSKTTLTTTLEVY